MSNPQSLFGSEQSTLLCPGCEEEHPKTQFSTLGKVASFDDCLAIIYRCRCGHYFAPLLPNQVPASVLLIDKQAGTIYCPRCDQAHARGKFSPQGQWLDYEAQVTIYKCRTCSHMFAPLVD